MSAKLKVGVLAAGMKGLMAAQGASRHGQLEVVATYPPRGTREPGPEAFRNEFPETEIVVGRSPDITALTQRLDALFLAGWQFLIEPPAVVPAIVLHDSLLPDLRGFAPTVTALVLGRPRLGVSAVLPGLEADSGELLAQHAVDITHPLRIADALELLRPCYAGCIRDVLSELQRGALSATPQDESLATYSIWRDEEDYWIDFRHPADRVLRTIMALGDPYPGSRTTVDGRIVTIHGADLVEDLEFAMRQPGKIWQLDKAGPVVVCGEGMIRLTDMRDETGAAFQPSRLRSRFGAPPNTEAI